MHARLAVGELFSMGVKIKVTEENMTVVQQYDLTSSGKIRQLLTLFLHKN